MLEFLLFVWFILSVIYLCLLISILRTVDDFSDSIFDIEKSLRILKKRGKR